MCNIFWSTIIQFLIIIKTTNSVNVLIVDHIPSPSHQIWNRPLVFSLLEKGYNITYIAPDLIENVNSKNLSQILFEGIYDKAHEDLNMNEYASYGPVQSLYEFQQYCVVLCGQILETNGLKHLLEYPSNAFDLLILDITANSCLYPLIHKFNYPPTVGVTAFLLPPYLSNNFGNLVASTSIPWYGLPYTGEMSFMERFWNSVFVYGELIFRNLKQYSEEYNLAKEKFGKIPSMAELERHISILLSNTDPLLDLPRSLSPNIIPVGGLHTRPSKAVSEDLKTLLDNSKGAIIFSLGSNVRCNGLSKDVKDTILQFFSTLKETVIWKCESEIDNLPKNVITRKWISQNDLLGHPKVKLFIGHGGALSTQEAMFHGVPMVAIPFVADQIINTKMISHRKIGEGIDFDKITLGEFSTKVKQVLEDPM